MSRRGRAVPPERRTPRWGRLALGAVAAAAVLYAGARFAVSRPAFEARVRERLAAALRQRLGDVSIGERISFDWVLRPSFGPISVPGGRGANPILAIESARVRPRLLALLRGRLAPAAVDLRGVRLSPGPGGRDLRALARRAGTRPGGTAGGGGDGIPRLHVRDLVVTLPSRDASGVDVGPFEADVSASAAAGGTRLAVEVRLARGGRADLVALRTRDAWRFHARARGISPAALQAQDRTLPARLDAGELSFDVEGDASLDLSRATARISAAAEGVFLSGERLGDRIGPLEARAAGMLAWDGVRRRASLRDGKVTVQGALPIAAAAEVRLEPAPAFSLSLAAPDVDYRALAAALPPPLAPPSSAPRPAGTFGARLEVEGPLAEPAGWIVSASLDLSRMREAARRGPPVALRRTFEHRPLDAGERPPAIVVGPESADFVPVAELPEHVVRAVTASEDAGFFAHQGFDFHELRNALAQGAEAGRVVRGGSTITQQLAKNLYLSQERTVARKIREALVTIALESSVPKRRLLEIYLNVAEWGPGLWGIGPAARHWFGKDARALTPKEAAFLASIIPNPVRYHFMFARGSPTESWEQRVDELLLKMTSQGVISDDDLVHALGEPIVFGGG